MPGVNKHLNVVISLPGENHYLHEQAVAAEATAQRLGIKVRVINAGSDPVNQSQQLLEIIQSSPAQRPDALIVEPVTESGLPRVAEAATSAGIGWVISNARVDYLDRLRQNPRVPVFSVSQDHAEIGRIQARQFAALLPEGGTILYLRGPASNSLAGQRAEGVESATPANIRIKTLKIQWTEESAYHLVTSWLRLSTVHASDVHLLSSQNTDFISAARRAFQDHARSAERPQWLNIPCTAAGLLNQTKPLVETGVLTAAVVTALTVDTALEMLRRAFETGLQPAERTVVAATSYPSMEELAKKHVAKAALGLASK